MYGERCPFVKQVVVFLECTTLSTKEKGNRSSLHLKFTSRCSKAGYGRGFIPPSQEGSPEWEQSHGKSGVRDHLEIGISPIEREWQRISRSRPTEGGSSAKHSRCRRDHQKCRDSAFGRTAEARNDTLFIARSRMN